jgi:hypothetical protein
VNRFGAGEMDFQLLTDVAWTITDTCYYSIGSDITIIGNITSSVDMSGNGATYRPSHIIYEYIQLNSQSYSSGSLTLQNIMVTSDNIITAQLINNQACQICSSTYAPSLKLVGYILILAPLHSNGIRIQAGLATTGMSILSICVHSFHPPLLRMLIHCANCRLFVFVCRLFNTH